MNNCLLKKDGVPAQMCTEIIMSHHKTPNGTNASHHNLIVSYNKQLTVKKMELLGKECKNTTEGVWEQRDKDHKEGGSSMRWEKIAQWGGS